MKHLIIAVFLLPFACFAQPGSKIDIGKMKKSYEVEEVDNYIVLQDVVKRLPDGYKKAPIVDDPEEDYMPRYGYLDEPNALYNYHLHRSFRDDTASVSYKNEFLEIRPRNLFDKVIPQTIVSMDYVTNSEWKEFEKYAIDSSLRKMLAESGEQWLIRVNNENGDAVDRSLWNINWDEKLDRSNEETMSHMMTFYYPPHERLITSSRIDTRKIYYDYSWLNHSAVDPEDYEDYYELRGRWKILDLDNIIENKTSLYHDSTFWIRDTSYAHFGNYEDGLVAFYNSHEYFGDYPVTGISSGQAKAFLHWKERNHQKALDKKGIPLWVEYDLPNEFDLRFIHADKLPKRVKIAPFDLTPWRISHEEYQTFMSYVRDSIAMRILGDANPDKWLMPVYDDLGNEYDIYEWRINWKNRIDWEELSDKERNMINAAMFKKNASGETVIDQRKFLCEQIYFNFKDASILGTGEWWSELSIYESSECNKELFELDPVRRYCDSYIKKDLYLGWVNELCYGEDLLSHTDRSTYIMRDRVNVYPTIDWHTSKICCEVGEDAFNEANMRCTDYDFDQPTKRYNSPEDKDAPIEEITYRQFRAYWHWRMQHGEFPVKSDNPVILNYIPSYTEFHQLQKDKMETVHSSEAVYSIPTPTFRCVVRFYPRDL